jgi:hypothetical protein
MRTIFGNVPHSVEQYANNRAGVSHQPTRPTGTANAPIQVRQARPTVSLAP